MAITAMMVGASRSGKTSILSSMFGSYGANTELSAELPIRDDTVYDSTNKGKSNKKRLKYQVSEMKDMLKTDNGGCANMPGLLGTRGVTEYSFKIDTHPMNLDKSLKGLPEIELTVMDIPGENFQSENNCIVYKKILGEFAPRCQILIVAVDVPSMMYAAKIGKDYYQQTVNCNEAVQDLIGKLGNDLGSEAPRLLIFVPIKCEYWAKGIGGVMLKDVNEEIKKVYKTQIEIFEKFRKAKVLIMPLETIGGLVFDHHTPKGKMKILLHDADEEIEGSDGYEWNGKMSSRCEKDCDGVVILPNGQYYNLEKCDSLEDVPEELPFAYSPEQPIPYTWYKAYGNCGYSPKNCDQLFLQLLQFSVQCVAQKSNYSIRELVENGFGFWARRGIAMGGYKDSRQVYPLLIRLHNFMKKGLVKGYLEEVYNTFDKDDSRLSLDF